MNTTVKHTLSAQQKGTALPPCAALFALSRNFYLVILSSGARQPPVSRVSGAGGTARPAACEAGAARETVDRAAVLADRGRCAVNSVAVNSLTDNRLPSMDQVQNGHLNVANLPNCLQHNLNLSRISS